MMCDHSQPIHEKRSKRARRRTRRFLEAREAAGLPPPSPAEVRDLLGYNLAAVDRILRELGVAQPAEVEDVGR